MILGMIQSLWGSIISNNKGKLAKHIKDFGNEDANRIMSQFKEDQSYEIMRIACEELKEHVQAQLNNGDPKDHVTMAYCQAIAIFPDLLNAVVEDLSTVDIVKRIDENLNNTAESSLML